MKHFLIVALFQLIANLHRVATHASPRVLSRQDGSAGGDLEASSRQHIATGEASLVEEADSGSASEETYLEDSEESDAALLARVKKIEMLVATERNALSAQQDALQALQQRSEILEAHDAQLEARQIAEQLKRKTQMNADGEAASVLHPSRMGYQFHRADDDEKEGDDEETDDDGDKKEEKESKKERNKERETKMPKKSKQTLALITVFGLGFFGVDRCYMGQRLLGIIKGITLGGCGVWYMVDYVIIMINCLAKWSTIDTVGYRARFPEDEINTAFWIALIALILHCVMKCTGAATHGHKAVAYVKKKNDPF